MTITLRLATPRDHRACAEVFLRSRRAAFYWLPPERFQVEDYEPSVVDEEVWVAVQMEPEHLVDLSMFKLLRSANFHLSKHPFQQVLLIPLKVLSAWVQA